MIIFFVYNYVLGNFLRIYSDFFLGFWFLNFGLIFFFEFLGVEYRIKIGRWERFENLKGRLFLVMNLFKM